jgi:phosphoribulokinase
MSEYPEPYISAWDKDWGQWSPLISDLERYIWNIGSYLVPCAEVAQQFDLIVLLVPLLNEETLDKTRRVLQGEEPSLDLLIETLIDVCLRENFLRAHDLIEFLSKWYAYRKIGRYPLVGFLFEEKVRLEKYRELYDAKYLAYC